MGTSGHEHRNQAYEGRTQAPAPTSIPNDEVYDGRELPKRVVRSELEDYGLRFYVGRYCATGLHRIKTKSGHCIGCSPASVAFQKRSADPGQVYVARCGCPGLVKVGSSTVGAPERIAALNAKGYAARSDWRLVESHEVDAAGRTEFLVHRTLTSMLPGSPSAPRAGECREVFHCPVEEALIVLRTVVGYLRKLPRH